MTNPTDPAFPESDKIDFNSGPALVTLGGLTKREYFAAMAMQGLVLDSESPFLCADVISSKAVAQADALIAELNNTENARRQAEGLK